MAGFCRVWISNFGLIAELFYEALKGKDPESLIWTALGNTKRPSMLLKKNFLMIPALGLPDLRKPFDLFVHERQVSRKY